MKQILFARRSLARSADPANVCSWHIATNRGATILWSLLGHNGHRAALAPEGSARVTHFGPQRVPFCRDAQDGPPATGKHAETINHIVGPRWEFFILPNPDISPESAVADPELPRTAVVMLMEPARSA
jgi:hypothetical protein